MNSMDDGSLEAFGALLLAWEIVLQADNADEALQAIQDVMANAFNSGDVDLSDDELFGIHGEIMKRVTAQYAYQRSDEYVAVLRVR